MRPLLSGYPTDTNAFRIDNEFLLADRLLVRPVNRANVSNVNVYFPMRNSTHGDIWYYIDDLTTVMKSTVTGYISIPVNRYMVSLMLVFKK